MASNNDLPDIGLDMSAGDLDLPAPDLSLDLPSPQDIDVGPVSKPVQAPARPAISKKAAPVKRPAKKTARPSSSILASIGLELISITLLLVFMVIMYFFGVPLDVLPSLSLISYVQCMWLLLGCFFVVAMLQDFKTALMLTGIDFVILATIFPTLWLLFDMRMNPMYFFVLTLMILLAFVYVPVNIKQSKKTGKASKAGQA
ncbi:hypothetical protein CUJ83_01920 [Methanocella sp. CWC-04]|uniref:Uncharacterized protein n=1 Tax=Methanooceanicella nereidis TaxID=2052831 RepID=A0AAP2RB27_9EURY|nr:hypothetical protein [Methanocella sp. CWC-04]MCD1293752.1 hypothetical protein [Methanocella sp. CWC-04]